MPGYAHPKWYYQFIEHFRVYLQAKNQLHLPCYSEYWLSPFCPINREPDFCQIWDWWCNINNNISFHFRLFLRKILKFLINFSKNPKKLFWGQFGSFLLRFGQKWIFAEKRALTLFKYSNYSPSCQKSEKTIESFVRKMLNWQMDRQTTVVL